MDLKKSFYVESRARDEGTWVDLPGTSDGTAVKVRSEDYPPFRRAILHILQRQQGGGAYSQRSGVSINDPVKFDVARANAIVEHLLVDWKGFTSDGVEIAFSKDAAKNLLTDYDYYDLYLAVNEAITSVTRQKKDWEEDRKNS